MRPLRIALLSHSVLPRGGVIHTLELAEALARLGHEPVVHAPDPAGVGFPRAVKVETRLVLASPNQTDVHTTILNRIGDYTRHFAQTRHRDFDLYHAQDGVSGNALLNLRRAGLISRALRTVHHLDDFADQRLTLLDRTAIIASDGLFAASAHVAREIKTMLGCAATPVGNGVDLRRFTPQRDGTDAELARRFDLTGPMILATGGISDRKNTPRLIEAFIRLRQKIPQARLLIGGGASLLDHSAARRAAEALMAELPEGAIVETGPLADELMPALYRAADCMAFPSLNEGFGLSILEAMACGTPVVVSRVAPLTDFLTDEVVWCDPLKPASIAMALSEILQIKCAGALVPLGHAAAARHGWDAVAAAHLPLYSQQKEICCA